MKESGLRENCIIRLNERTERKDSEHRQRMYTGNIPQIGRPPECRHASNSSIDGKSFPAFLLYSLFLGKIFTPYVGKTKFN